MSAFDLFEIEVDKQNSFYLCGENLKGSVKLKLNQKIKISSIKLYLNGDARVKWNGFPKGGQGGFATENYVNRHLTLLSQENSSDFYLEETEYNLDFEFILDHDLPSSFEGPFGHIRYFLTAIVEREWIFDKISKIPILVKNILDLNKNPSWRQAFGVSDQLVICCGMCKSDPIIVNFSISKCGYVCNEKIEFKVNIENKSSREIKNVRVMLRQNVEYHANGDKTWTTDVIKSVSFESSIETKKNVLWECDDLTVPQVPQTCTGRLIEITYSLVLKCRITGSFAKKIQIPLVIGLIPINT